MKNTDWSKCPLITTPRREEAFQTFISRIIQDLCLNYIARLTILSFPVLKWPNMGGGGIHLTTFSQ